MKKSLALLLVLVMSIGLFAGCSQSAEGLTQPEEQAEAPAETPEEVAEVQEGEIAKLGLGHVISIAKSTDSQEDKAAQAQVDVTIMAVGFDSEGRVVSAELDVAQTRVAFDEEMAVVTDKEGEFLTKKELGPDYGMVRASGIEKEWFEQAEALEAWMVGKTVEEITSMGIEDGKTTEEDLVSSVTVGVADYLAALEQAWNEAVETEGGETVGLGVKTSIAKSKDATEDAGAMAQVDTVISAAAFDSEGKVTGAIIDTAQVRVQYDLEGQVETDRAGEFRTKNELKEDYGMSRASGIEKEWYEQAAALADWMVGKTVEEITSMSIEDGKTTEEDLVSSVTIGVEDYLHVLAEAYERSK